MPGLGAGGGGEGRQHRASSKSMFVCKVRGTKQESRCRVIAGICFSLEIGRFLLFFVTPADKNAARVCPPLPRALQVQAQGSLDTEAVVTAQK